MLPAAIRYFSNRASSLSSPERKVLGNVEAQRFYQESTKLVSCLRSDADTVESKSSCSIAGEFLTPARVGLIGTNTETENLI